MLVSRSFRRKLLALLLTAGAVVLLYEATAVDSRRVALRAAAGEGLVLKAGSRMDFMATAYCRGEVTASGVNVRAGIAAADPGLLPQGSVVQVEGAPEKYQGIYTVMDTGPKVRGRHVDLYMWSCTEAVAFGRRPIRLTILRLGWNPKNTAPMIQ